MCLLFRAGRRSGSRLGWNGGLRGPGSPRLGDGARAAFSGDYLRQHITHGYAVTVHSAQGVTADTAAPSSANTTRAMLYVAMTRGLRHQHRLPVRADGR